MIFKALHNKKSKFGNHNTISRTPENILLYYYVSVCILSKQLGFVHEHFKGFKNNCILEESVIKLTFKHRMFMMSTKIKN